MKLNTTFPHIGAWFNEIEASNAERDEIELQLSATQKEILFTTSDDDYEFCSRLSWIIENEDPIIRTVHHGDVYQFDFEKSKLTFNFEYVEGGLIVVKFKNTLKNKLDKFVSEYKFDETEAVSSEE